MERPKQPADIARDAMTLLAKRRKPPTPVNFQKAYAEVAGIEDKPEPRWVDVIRPLMKQWDAHQAGLTQTRKREMLERVLINFGHDAPQLHDKLTALAKSWSTGGASEPLLELAGESAPPTPESPAAVGTPGATGPAPVATVPAAAATAPAPASAGEADRPLLQALADNFQRLATTCDGYWPDLAKRAGKLARALGGQASLEPAQFEEWAALWREILIRAENNHELSAGLKRLVGLLFLNIGELVGDEAWLSGQLTTMQTLMAGDLRPEVLLDAERSLRELAFKQGVIKGSLDEAKAKLKTLISTFIDRIGEMSQHADGYHARIGEYSEKISQASDISELGDVIEGLSTDMAGMRDALHVSHADLVQARTQAEQAEQRIQQLEQELHQISNLVREDQLTGTLNRRGMEEAFQRELARTQRLSAPLCIGLLDIDHFKKLNDSLGHQAGDEALRHLAKVIGGLLRPTDTLARYGGEEFLVLLPNTAIAEAETVLKRMQRELTRQFFLHENEKILITFSAGVAEYQPEEEQSALIARADGAMYRAKATGRNRVERG